MKLANLLALIDGLLLSRPFIESFENITFTSKKVKRGDIFIALNHEEIEEAVLNGAYAIIFEKPTQITDAEIAWIKVDDLQKSFLKLLRFIILEKKLLAYHCDHITISLASQIVTSDVIILDKNIYEDANKILDTEDKSVVLYLKESFDKDLFVSSADLPNLTMQKIKVIEQTLFETSFIFNDIFYERQLLSPFFMIYLEKILNFYLSLNINFRLKQFRQIDHFRSVFVTNSLEVKDFGLTQKVLIFEPNFSLFDEQIQFLKKEAPWANMIYIIPERYAHIVTKVANLFTYSDEKDIITILKKLDFNFALIVEADDSILKRDITESKKGQLSLDF